MYKSFMEVKKEFFCCDAKWLQTHPPEPRMDNVKTDERHYRRLAFRASNTLDCISIIILGSNCIQKFLKFGWFEATKFSDLIG